MWHIFNAIDVEIRKGIKSLAIPQDGRCWAMKYHPQVHLETKLEKLGIHPSLLTNLEELVIVAVLDKHEPAMGNYSRGWLHNFKSTKELSRTWDENSWNVNETGSTIQCTCCYLS